MSFSSIGVEILTAEEYEDQSILLKEFLKFIFIKFPFHIAVDSFGLFSTITTYQEGLDYHLLHEVE